MPAPRSRSHDLARELAPLVRKDLLSAAKALQQRDGEHAARVRLKRLRARLRLARDAMSSRRRKRADEFCAAQGRALGATRDLQAREQLLTALERRAPLPLRPTLGEQVARVRVELTRDAGDAARLRVARKLTRHAERCEKWFTRKTSPALMHRRLRRELQALTRAARQVLAAPDTEGLHRLRRRVKRAHLMQRLLATASSRGRGPLPLASLARRLGADHDRALVLDELRGDSSAAADGALRDWIGAVHVRSRTRLIAALRTAFAPRRATPNSGVRPRIVG